MPDSIALSQHAAKLASSSTVVTGIACQATSFFRPSSIDQLVAYLTPIAAAGGSLPFYYYHIPSMTNVNLPVDQIFPAARAAIPTFAGAKFSDTDLFMFGKCVRQLHSNEAIYYGVFSLL
jgi:N-acetylneuraminate lyase